MRFDKWENSLGQPYGTVLQVVSATKVDAFSTTSSTFVDVPDLSVTITPKNINSKILITIDVSTGSSQDGDVILNLNRGSTAIAQPNFGNNPSSAYSRPRDSLDVLYQGITFLDSPATVSSITYKVQMRILGSGTRFINRRGNDTILGFISSITAKEIAQ
jgi:hypothetical protein